MKQLAITALLALTGISAQAQQSEVRKSEAFTTLEVKDGIEVIVTQRPSTSLKVESDSPANLEDIVTEYSKGALKVYMREPANGKAFHGTARVYVSTPVVNSIQAKGGSSVKADGKLAVAELTIKLAVGATFTGEVSCSKKCTIKAESGSMFRGHATTAFFDGTAYGGATIRIKGKADKAVIVCSNGSMIADQFIISNAEVKTVKASTAFINASKSISAEADDTSSITYYGKPLVNLRADMYSIKRGTAKLALNR